MKVNNDDWDYPAGPVENERPPDHNQQAGRASDVYLAEQIVAGARKWEAHGDMAARRRLTLNLRRLCKRCGIKCEPPRDNGLRLGRGR